MTKRQRLTKRLRASKTEESVEKLEMRGQESKEAKRKTGRKGDRDREMRRETVVVRGQREGQREERELRAQSQRERGEPAQPRALPK